MNCLNYECKWSGYEDHPNSRCSHCDHFQFQPPGTTTGEPIQPLPAIIQKARTVTGSYAVHMFHGQTFHFTSASPSPRPGWVQLHTASGVTYEVDLDEVTYIQEGDLPWSPWMSINLGGGE